MEQDERKRRIAEGAYRRAEARGFAGNRELDDWLEAEREIDAAFGPASGMDDGTPLPAQTRGNAIPQPFDKEEVLREDEIRRSASDLSRGLAESESSD